jgi:hypothetical protein
MGMKQKKIFFEKQYSKWLTQKKKETFKSTNSHFFSIKFQGLVFGLVELIDAKGIDVAYPIRLRDCLT